MTSQTSIIAQQITRLMISKEDKQRLLEELKQVDAEKLKLLTDLIHQHDEEALSILNEKVSEQMKLKEHFQEVKPDMQKPSSREQAGEIIQKLELIFNDPEALAQLFVSGDAVFLMQLEELLTKSLENDPTSQQEFKKFFAEIRLQKTALAQQWKEEDRERLMNEIVTNEKNSKQLDVLIAQAQKVLNSK